MTTLGGALRTDVVNSGLLGQAIYRDVAPPEAVPPYGVFSDFIGDAPELLGDGKVIGRKQGLQFDLYELEATEDSGLLKALRAVLDGALLETADYRVFRCRVTDTRRMAEPIYGYIRHMIMLTMSYET